MNLDDTKHIRSAVARLHIIIDQRGDTPLTSPAQTFVPMGHARALDVETTLVEGIRGAGKSFWWSVLSDGKHRQFLAAAFPQTFRIDSSVRIAQGFGAATTAENSPTRDTIEQLTKRYTPRAIWRSVIATHAGFKDPFPLAVEGRNMWEQRANWVQNNPEDFDALLSQVDSELETRGETLLILFDALDRLASQWHEIRPLAQALLQVALDMRSTKRIRLKLFVRPDMLEDRRITSFPDFSKLNASKASLEWKRADLYALAFQRIGNSTTGGPEFRGFSTEAEKLQWLSIGGQWGLPARLARDEETQEHIFIALAGPAMGAGVSGHKRGKPYTWLVNHLQDGRNQVSPRSFLSALGEAGSKTEEEYPLAISAKAIQEGVQHASTIRVDEFQSEDYPWVKDLMEPLRGHLTVPCGIEDILDRWKEDGTIDRLKAELTSSHSSVKLPPQHLDQGGRGVLADIQDLGLIQLQEGDRVQMPDVYRIAFGIGRRGGVKPLK